METSEFEEKINAKAKHAYDIKTGSSAILLKAAEEKKNAKPPFWKKKWFVPALSSLLAVSVIGAIAVPLALSLFPASSEDDFSSISYIDPTYPTGKAKTETLSYEATALSSLLGISSIQDSSVLLSARKGNADDFEKTVQFYENMQSTVYSAFSAQDVPVSEGSFAGQYGNYPYQMVLANHSTFYFDLDISDEIENSALREADSNSFSGEVLASDGKTYLVGGTTSAYGNGRLNLSMNLYLNTAKTRYLVIDQDLSKGSFFYSVSFYAKSAFVFEYSLHLVNVSAKSGKMVILSYSTSARTRLPFRVFQDDADHYEIYRSGWSDPIALTYSNEKRTYSYLDATLVF